MFAGRLIFKQVMDFMPLPTFRGYATKYKEILNIRSLPCLDQFLGMTLAQITHRKSLRDLEIHFRSQNKKLYHMGIRGRVSKSTLGEGNEKRDWHRFAELEQSLIETVGELYKDDSSPKELDETVYALAATTIDLCFSVYPWAK